MRVAWAFGIGCLLLPGCVCAPSSGWGGWGGLGSSGGGGGGGSGGEGEAEVAGDDSIAWQGGRITVPAGATVERQGETLRLIVDGGVVELSPRGALGVDARVNAIRQSDGFVTLTRSELGPAAWFIEWVAAPEGEAMHGVSRRVRVDGAVLDCEGVASPAAAAVIVQACASVIEDRVEPVAEVPEGVPTPPDVFGVDLGVSASVETRFTDCTDPEGLSVAAFGGVAVRPDGYHGVAAQVGASAGAGAVPHADGTETRLQLWGGLGYQVLAKTGNVATTFSPIVTWSHYRNEDTRMEEEAVGGGAAVDVRVKTAGRMFLVDLRMYGDAHGLYAGWSLGFALAD